MMKINVGAGKNPPEGYINIDRATGGEAYPLSQNGIVFDTGVADEIRASHVLEHFSHTMTLAVLKEWIRVLKPGGLLKIAVPDFDHACSLRKSDPLWKYYIFGGHTDQNDMHGALFTRDDLKDLMREAGCIVQYADMYWRDDLDYCSSHPSGVSLNLQGFKREDVVDVEKPFIPAPRKIVAIMSAPRIGFTKTHGCIENVLAAYQIKLMLFQGAFWEQGVQNCFEKAIAEGYDDAIVLDFDSVFNQEQFHRMYSCWLLHPELDAIAPLQPKRGDGRAMLTPMDVPISTQDKESHVTANHQETGLQVQTAHFGLTFFRLNKLAKMAKPWFWNQPAKLELPQEISEYLAEFENDNGVSVSEGYCNDGRRSAKEFIALFDKHFGLRFGLPGEKLPDSGRWKTGGAVDSDIYFWMKWQSAGNNLHVITDVFLGHLEIMVGQHNPQTGYASYRYSSEYCNDPFAGKSADVKLSNPPVLPQEYTPINGNVLNPINDYEITEKNYFDDSHLFLDDNYPQSFVQESKTCLGEPSTDLSGSEFQNITEGRKATSKQRRIHVVFAGKRYDQTVAKIVLSTEKFGSTDFKIYDDNWLIENCPKFIDERAGIFFDHPKSEKVSTHWREIKDRKFTRGFGWFCWKPFIIQHALDNFCDEGDIVLYSDADTYPITDLTPFYDHADENGCMLFAAAHLRQRHWCKRDTMRYMQMDCDKYRDMQAGNARYMLFKKGARIGSQEVSVNKFLGHWLELASNKDLTTFELSQDEYPELLPQANGKALGQHRCEQAILTNLAHWYGIPLHRPPCQDGNSYV